jgi:hypothetical protein
MKTEQYQEIDDAARDMAGDLSAKPNEDQVIAAMTKHGGVFVHFFAAAYQVADPENRGKIRTTWAELWEKYEGMVGK